MREIKFRAWDKKKKRWIGVSKLEHLCVGRDVVVLVRYAPSSDGKYNPVSCSQLTWEEIENLEIVESTGHRDRNRREIYSSDLVSIYDSDVTGEIVWFNLSWQIKDGGMLCLFDSDVLEIVGNIQEGFYAQSGSC